MQTREQCERTDRSGRIINANCSTTCQVTSIVSCGDGVLQQGEECDDRNVRDNDGCTSLCRIEKSYCQDGTLCGKNKCGSGVACSVAYCGDGIVNSALNEECDDGNRDSDDDCDVFCKWVPLPECGDGIVQSQYELCDDGEENSNAPNAECRINCVPERCGDGIFDSFIEECDDGNNLSNDGCSAVCTLPEGAAPWSSNIGGVLVPPESDPDYFPPNIPTPARTPTGPGLAIFLASGAAAGVGLMRRRLGRRR